MSRESANHFEYPAGSSDIESSGKIENLAQVRQSFECKLSSGNKAAEWIAAELLSRGWTEKEIGVFDNAVDEAVQNAIIHGNWGLQHIEGESPDQYLLRERKAEAAAHNTEKIEVTVRFEKDSVEATVAGAPQPFDRSTVPDPTTGEALFRPSGRGLKIIEFSDNVEFFPNQGVTILRKFKKVRPI